MVSESTDKFHYCEKCGIGFVSLNRELTPACYKCGSRALIQLPGPASGTDCTTMPEFPYEPADQ